MFQLHEMAIAQFNDVDADLDCVEIPLITPIQNWYVYGQSNPSLRPAVPAGD